MRRPGPFFLVLLLAVPPAGFAQAPPESEGSGIAGEWLGFARLTNDWPKHRCSYQGSNEENSVRLEISLEEGRLQGSVAIDLPPVEGSKCPPLRKRFLVTEVVLAEGTVSLTDSGGHDWDLSQVQEGRALQGMMTWQRGAVDEPLADGFAFADGTKPGSRLSGEVRLRKAREVPGGEEDAESQKSTSGGTYVKHVGAILGATVVGLGGLYAVNELGSGSSEEGTITCSPRRCVVGAPGEPCFCEGNVVSGSDCGETETGVPIGEACVWPTRPCQALLSCNSGVCQDRFGFCPFTGGPGSVSALPPR